MQELDEQYKRDSDLQSIDGGGGNKKKAQIKYLGGNYVVHTGPRGGKYIKHLGNKVYI